MPKGGYSALTIKIKLPDGRVYDQAGELNFTDNTVQTSTDTIILRGTIPNPKLAMATKKVPIRELYDNEFVTVMLQGVQPVQVLGIPRAAVLMDQQRRVRLGRRGGQQGRAPDHQARPVHAGRRLRAQRPEGRRSRRGRRRATGEGRRGRRAVSGDAGSDRSEGTVTAQDRHAMTAPS